ncbi:MAG: hypothetical protein ABI351_12005 [Herbaspirillum sp.]
MKRTLYILVFTLVIYPIASFSQQDRRIDQNLENISGKYAECAAYYELIYHAMNSSNREETANAYRKLEDKAMFYSLLLANEGRSKDVAINVTNSRIDMYMKGMKQEANNRNENISILINKYHSDCDVMIKNPLNEVLEIMNRNIKN